jgi:hypothetical protein
MRRRRRKHAVMDSEGGEVHAREQCVKRDLTKET